MWQGLALVAVGGYGRAELSPASDLDVVLLHDPAISEDRIQAIAEAIWYPLWERGVALDHSVRDTVQMRQAAQEDYRAATSQLAQTTLRSVLGKHELDAMLAERDKLNSDLQAILDAETDGWGIKVTNVEIKHVDIDESMVRAIARQAEAERIRRAKIINAEGEQQAAEKLVEAAAIIERSPAAMQLRYLATLYDIASEKNSTIIFPMPMDLMCGLERLVGGAGRAG